MFTKILPNRYYDYQVRAYGFDGNPSTKLLTDGHGDLLDITNDLQLNPSKEFSLFIDKEAKNIKIVTVSILFTIFQYGVLRCRNLKRVS